MLRLQRVRAIDGVVFAYQFDSSADYQASLAAFNRAEGFDPARPRVQLPDQAGSRATA